MNVFWTDRPWPRVPWDNSSAPVQPEEERAVRRSEARSVDGRPCGALTSTPSYPANARASAEVLDIANEYLTTDIGEAVKHKVYDLGINLSAVTCCGTRSLRATTPEEKAQLPLAMTP